MLTCQHRRVSIINPYELIRKYKCEDCGKVMMCGCDEELGTRFLPHQISTAHDLQTRRMIRVTGGFQLRVCNTCRGLPEQASPMAETYGRSSKLLRYYWREIEAETIRRFGAWCAETGETDWISAQHRLRDVYDSMEKKVIDEIRHQHEVSPKYTYVELSQNEVLERCEVEIVKLEAVYALPAVKGAPLADKGARCSPEDFAADYFRRQGYTVCQCESRPFHVLFGVFMWLLIQDPADPLRQLSGFGERATYDEGRESKLIWTWLPRDFGASGYFERRRNAVKRHFKLITNEDDWNWLFEYWLVHSEDFRQYLWAHKSEDVERAREVLSVLPRNDVVDCLLYLIEHYWGRYLGWPDLLVYRGTEFFFAEVKSSRDKLSEDQKRWIQDNFARLHLPFKLVKIHRVGEVDMPL